MQDQACARSYDTDPIENVSNNCSVGRVYSLPRERFT
jgi:hypothetical protein